ncbi:hypothetical protein B0J12DRAFT_432701 [Macrophomina phaseolina]|uniref:Transmembrane protein n=1 Tax=Macrophomina phaseolina TaxID=35725 RepID=A0ABQ8GHA9_9PEZI|nr:hypothetical protein B0J12DRAFT_432701 [Macrophomina phaseolina]
MPAPWIEFEARRAREDYKRWEDYTNAVEDAWEELTTLPAVVTIMGTPFTFDSTGMPPWLSTQDAPDALQGTDGQLSVPQPQTAAATTSAFIGMTQPTTASELPTVATSTGPQSGSSAALSGPVYTSAMPPASASASGTNSASTSESPGNGNGDGDDPSGGGPPLGLILAAVIIPVLITTLLAFTVFVVLRRRKQRKAAEHAPASEEMKLRLSDDFPPPGSPPAISAVPSREATPQAPPRAVTPAPPPAPVIVSAMNPANNSSYFTGIDTSEALSVRTNSVRSGPRTAGFMLDGEFHEEPPPPYRPRSVPPISRDSSMRTNNRADCASTYLMADDAQRSNPFADPSDDDNESIESGMGPYSRRADDHLSVVSDLSYQNEPTAVHQAV